MSAPKQIGIKVIKSILVLKGNKNKNQEKNEYNNKNTRISAYWFNAIEQIFFKFACLVDKD